VKHSQGDTTSPSVLPGRRNVLDREQRGRGPGGEMQKKKDNQKTEEEEEYRYCIREFVHTPEEKKCRTYVEVTRYIRCGV